MRLEYGKSVETLEDEINSLKNVIRSQEEEIEVLVGKLNRKDAKIRSLKDTIKLRDDDILSYKLSYQ